MAIRALITKYYSTGYKGFQYESANPTERYGASCLVCIKRLANRRMECEPMVNVKPVQLGKTTRMSFARINEVLDMPNLIEVQKNSYRWFLEEGLK